MCGIAGILDLKGRAVEQPVLERLCACLAHRGPDDEGFHVEGNVGLGQRGSASSTCPAAGSR